MADSSPKEEGSALFFNLVAITLNSLVLCTGVFCLLIGSWSFSWETLSTFNATSIGVTILLLQLFYTIVSLATVPLDEQAILLLFGAYMKDVDSGLVYVPWGVCTLLRATTGIMEKDLPAAPEFIWHGDATKSDGKIPDGYFPPIRVTFAAKPDKPVTIALSDNTTRNLPEDDAYLQRNTAEVEAAYGWRIVNLRKFAEKFGTRNPVRKAQSQMDDTSIGAINDILSRLTAAEAMTLMTTTAEEVEDRLTEESKDWGIVVEFVRMKPFGFSHALNESVRLAAESLPRKVAVIRESEGEMVRRTNVGLGIANAEYDLLAARAEAESLLAEVASTPGGRYAMAVQATQRGLETARAVIVPQDNLFGAVAGVTQMMKRLDGELPPTQTPTGESGGQPTTEPPRSPKPPTPRSEPRYGSGRKGRDRK